MIINVDAAQLEWRAVAHLSGDKIAIEEINNGLDFHTDNQTKFKLPSRLIAKVFLFRNIYCPRVIADKTAYAYSVDNDFKSIGGVKFWRYAIEAFYDKYTGIEAYHTKLIREAQTTGKIVSETGRTYFIEPRQRYGEWVWPLSDIANYPVQGFSADLMSLARVSAYRRITERKFPCLFVNSVHDSIVLDHGGNLKEAVEIAKTLRGVFRDLPDNFKKIYGKELLVPMDCDAKVGVNWLWMHKLKI